MTTNRPYGPMQEGHPLYQLHDNFGWSFMDDMSYIKDYLHKLLDGAAVEIADTTINFREGYGRFKMELVTDYRGDLSTVLSETGVQYATLTPDLSVHQLHVYIPHFNIRPATKGFSIEVVRIMAQGLS